MTPMEVALLALACWIYAAVLELVCLRLHKRGNDYRRPE